MNRREFAKLLGLGTAFTFAGGLVTAGDKVVGKTYSAYVKDHDSGRVYEISGYEKAELITESTEPELTQSPGGLVLSLPRRYEGTLQINGAAFMHEEIVNMLKSGKRVSVKFESEHGSYLLDGYITEIVWNANVTDYTKYDMAVQITEFPIKY